MFSSHNFFVVTALLSQSVATSFARETINFDFAWRHFLGSPSGNVSRTCTAGTKGINYGTGGNKISNVMSPEDCCSKCAEQPWCGCWDLNIQVNAALVGLYQRVLEHTHEHTHEHTRP